ncbi:apyrase-like isoform X1 [Leguminivora glycinivorella]|uniref:apyrase-like isoform X1 n=1 Tax=Leguminivora glycinivorella TaxID=1035111 RepID=UPI00200E87A6|nr:apyrase-like isoform X1 [Leguminivora glycinivorella]
MKVFDSVLFLCAILGTVSGGVLRNDTFTLDIVHYNDFHARFEETSVKDTVCKTNDTACLGGFARLYYEIKHIINQKPDSLLLNAGDDFQGTYWYTLLKDKVTSTFINMLPNDAHTLGNHEFDDGVAGLVPYLKALNDPVVVANLDVTLEPSLQGLFQPHVVLERNGRKIGIIGVTTPDTKDLSNPEGVKFLDPIPIVQREAKLLTEQGIDIIIVLSHCGIYVDKAMAKAVGENVDIIVGGHTHSLLWNGPAPSHEVVLGSYPEFQEADNRPGHKVLVVTASAYSKYLGHIGVNFDSNGEVVSYDAEPVFLNRSIPEDPNIKALLKPYMDQIHRTINGVVGTATDELTMCGVEECPLGDIIAESFLDVARQKAPSNLTSISFIFNKMIRTFIGKGDITQGDLMNVLPFGSAILSYTIQGKYVKQELAECLKNNPHNLPQVGGLKLTINTTSNVIDSILAKEGDEWKPMEDEKEYQVVTPQFVKDKSTHLNTNAKDVVNMGKDWEALLNYVKKITIVNSSVDGRLQIIS